MNWVPVPAIKRVPLHSVVCFRPGRRKMTGLVFFASIEKHPKWNAYNEGVISKLSLSRSIVIFVPSAKLVCCRRLPSSRN